MVHSLFFLLFIYSFFSKPWLIYLPIIHLDLMIHNRKRDEHDRKHLHGKLANPKWSNLKHPSQHRVNIKLAKKKNKQKKTPCFYQTNYSNKVDQLQDAMRYGKSEWIYVDDLVFRCFNMNWVARMHKSGYSSVRQAQSDSEHTSTLLSAMNDTAIW